MRQSGLIEVDDVEPIVDIAKLFAQGRLPNGNAVGVLSISGGSGIVFADAAVRGGLTLPPFSDADARRAAQDDPGLRLAENPADITAGVFNDTTLFTSTLEIVLAGPGARSAVDPARLDLGRAARRAAAEVIAAAPASTDKPVHVAWSGRHGKSAEAVQALEDAGVPFVTTPVRLARAAAVLARFAADRRRLLPRKAPAPVAAEGPDAAGRRGDAERGREQGGAARVRRAGGARRCFVPAGADVGAAPTGLEGPFAVKIVSRDIAAQDRGRRRQARRGARGARRGGARGDRECR